MVKWEFQVIDNFLRCARIVRSTTQISRNFPYITHKINSLYINISKLEFVKEMLWFLHHLTIKLCTSSYKEIRVSYVKIDVKAWWSLFSTYSTYTYTHELTNKQTKQEIMFIKSLFNMHFMLSWYTHVLHNNNLLIYIIRVCTCSIFCTEVVVIILEY